MKNILPIKKMGAVTEVFNGKTPSKSEQRTEGLPILKIRDVNAEGKFKGKFESFVDKKFYSRYENKKIVENDTLILNAAHSSTHVASKSFFATKIVHGTIPTGEWVVIRPNNSVHPYYLNLWINSDRGKSTLKNLVRGIHLYPTDIKNIDLPLPPSAIQEKIVEKLDTIRKALELNYLQITKAEELYQSLFKENILDNDFNKVSLSEVVHPQDVVNPKKTPDQEYKYIDISAVDSEKFSVNKNSIKEFKGKDAPSRARKVVQENDILFSTVRPNLKRNAIIDFPTYNSLASTGFTILRPNQNKINPSYMGTVAASDIVTDQVVPMIRGAAYPAVSDKDVLNSVIPLPERKKQDEIAEKLEAVQNYKKILLKQKEFLKELFDSVLDSCMRGEINL